ncbi:MAG: Ig-like domain repeat protein [Acidobacteriota bacterium]
MYRSIPQTPSNRRVFGACLLSLMTLIAPIASVGAATRRAIVPLAVKNNKDPESAQPSLVEPAAAMPAPAPVPAPVPMLAVGPITATKTDSFPDPDGDGKAELGEVISYTVGISNTGTDAATGVNFDDIFDPNTTLVPGSLNVSPLAVNESYTAVGNTLLEVGNATAQTGPQKSVAGGVLSNGDTDYLGDTFTISAFDASSAFSGTVTMVTTGPDAGAFTYISAANFVGTDTFTYTLRDDGTDGIAGNADDLTGVGTVTITVANQVWYVDNGAAAGGDGRSTTPFDALSDVSGASGPDTAGDIIYINTGIAAYGGGIALLATQTLHGEGTALIVGPDTLAAAGTDPTITNAGGDGVTLGNGNTLTGFTVGNTTTYDIANTPTATVGTLNISNVVLNGSGNLFRADSGGALTVTFESATATSGVTSGILIAGSATGNFNVTGATTIDDATLDGISISNSAASATFTGAVTILNDGVGANGDGVDLSTNTGTYSFNGGLSITVNGAGAFGFRAQSSGTVNILDPGGTNQITSNNGTALLINPTTLNATLLSLTSGGGTEGISLTSMSGSLTIGTVSINGQTVDGIDITTSTGTVTINGGTIGNTNDPAGIGVDINGGTGNVTISATVNKTTAGDLVEVTGRSTNTVDFNGNLTSTGAAGIDLNTNTGGTVRFDGGMTLSTGAAIALNSTANTGMTLVVTDPGGLGVGNDNTLTTSTGIALNVANTTIGAEDLNFRSISSNGAANGIVLNTTGATGNLIVSGNGGSCTSTATCTGGAIQNSTNHAISLTSTNSPSFTRIAIQNAARSGIDGQSVTNFTLANSFIDNVGTGAVGQHDESNISFNDNGFFTANPAPLTGTVSITNNILNNARRHGIQIENGTGTISNLTITNNSLTSSSNSTVSLGNAIAVLQQGSASTVSHLTTGTISNNTVNNFPSGEGIFIGGGAGNSTNNTSSTLGANGTPINITSNTVNGGSSRLGNNAIRVSFNGQFGVSNFNVSCNGSTNAGAGCSATGPLTNYEGLGITIFMGGTVTGTTTVNNNVLVSNQTILAGSSGIGVQADDGPAGLATSQPNVNFTVNNNNVSNNEGSGILVFARASLAIVDATVQNNTVTAPTMTNRSGIRVFSGSSAGDTTLCAVITNNVSDGSGVNAGIGIRKEGIVAGTNEYGIVGLAPSPASAAQAEAKVEADNPLGGGVDINSGNNFVNCAQTAMYRQDKPTPTYALAPEPVQSDRANASVSLSDTRISFASIASTLKSLNVVESSAPALSPANAAQPSWPTAEAAVAGKSNGSTSARLLTTWLGTLVSSAAYFANSVDSLLVPTAHAETEKTEVRGQRSDVRLNHAKSPRSITTSAAPAAPAVAPMPPLTTVNIGTLPGLKGVTVVFQVTVNTTGLGTATSVTNQGTVSGTNFANVLTDDPSTGAPNDPTVTPISRLDVQVTKTDGVTSTTPGSDLTYTLTFTNNDHAANGVTLTETVPVGTVFKAAGSSVWTGCADGAAAGTVCTINLGNLPRFNLAGHTGTRTFVVTVLNPAPAGVNDIVNTASIAHDGTYEPDYIPANNTTTDTDTLNAAPDLNISKTDGVIAATPGSTLTYTINYSNVGTQNAAGVVLTETVPVGTTFTTTGSSAWTGCSNGSPAGTVCTISVGNLTAGAPAASATFAVVVTNPAAAGLTSIVNTASIADDGANGTDPTLPNTTTDTDTLDAAPDLTISKVADVTDVAPGDTIVYTITYANAGNQNATGVVITETVPVHTTFSTADSAPTVWSCPDNSPAATVCTTTIGALAGGGSGGTVKFAVKVVDPTPPLATQVSNTATIADDGGNGVDPTPGNNTTGAVITPIIVCTPPPANMTNWWTGDDTARDIAGGKDGTLNGDDGPADLEYSAGKVLNGFDFDGINDLVNVGDVDLLSTFTIDAWVNPTNLSIERAIVSKDDGAAQRSYFFHITSAGALRASVNSAGGFTVYQTADGVITAGSLQHVAVTYDGGAAAGLKMLFYKNGALVAATVQSGQDAGGIPENNSLAALIGRSATTNNTFLGVIDEVEFFSRVLSATELNAIFTADSGGKCKPSDLKITKTHTDPFVQGSTGNTYTITVHNDGPGITTGTTTVTDTLPPGLTATAMSGSGWTCPGPFPAPPASTTFTCTSIANIASGADFPAITLTVTAGVNMASVTNNVSVSGGGEMDTSDNTDSRLTNLTPSADLAVTKLETADPVNAGANITYNITFTNNGPSDALGVSLTDTVPTNTTFVSFAQLTGPTFTCTDPGLGGTGDVSCTIATMASGATATFDMVVKVNPGTASGTSITNSAVSAASGSTDTVSANNAGNTSTLVSTLTDVALTSKTDTPDPVVVGSNITYTINFMNNGPSNAATAKVTDAIPANTTLVSASTVSPGWTRTDGLGAGASSGTIEFSNSSAAPGAATFTVVLNVNPGTPDGTTITNIANTTTTTTESTTLNNSASTTTLAVTTLALIVNTTGDESDATPLGDRDCDVDLSTSGDQCTLRAAIEETNATVTDDSINFDASLSGSTISLASALPAINGNLNIIGLGADLLTVERNNAAATNFRIFLINSGMGVAISGLTISAGNLTAVNENGGGILNNGLLTLSNSTVSGNNVMAGSGGGIYSLGDLTINSSAIVGNDAAGEGGGVNSEAGTLIIRNSTISGNSAGFDGGGVLNCDTSTAFLTNVTITNNRADADGDASGNGGGIGQISSNPFTLSNTIVAGNFVGDSSIPSTTPDDIFVFGAPGIDTANSFNNLIGDAGTAGGFIDNTNGNRVGNAGVGTIDITTVLAPLANNGGATQTHALVPNSPAIDRGSNAEATAAGLTMFDQRETVPFFRTQDGNGDTVATVDIGAFEAGPDATAPTVVSIDDGDADNGVPVNTTLTYTITFNEDINGATVTAADFSNAAGASPAAITIGTITKTSAPGSPGVFTVQVTPTTGGNIVLSVGPAITDLQGNAMAAAQLDDNTVVSDGPPTLGNYPATSVVFGQSTTVTPDAAPADNAPGLIVSVAISAGFTGTSSVNSTTGVVTINNSGPASVSAYTVTVTANDGINPPVQKQFQLTVNKANTTTVLQSSANPSSVNQQVTFTATVSPVAPGAGTPTGLVDFLDGVTVICNDVPLSAGVATCLHTFVAPPGPHTLVANYLGSTNFNISSGGPLTQTVNEVTISGLKFTDMNGNGIFEAGEPGLPGVAITLYNDVNSNGLFDAGTDTVQGTQFTGAAGDYSFSGILMGRYVVVEGVPAGWVQTLPAPPGTYAVDASSGGIFANRNFGNFQLITISGRKFNDLNGNGNDNGGTDPGLNGFTIQLFNDVNGNGTFEAGTDTLNTQTVTANVAGQDGRYSFTNVGPGKYLVREVIPPEYIQTSPVSPGFYAITATSGLNVTGRDFGNFRLTTTTTVTSNLNPSFFTDPVTFTATVAANPPGSGTPTGTVTFLDGATAICTNVPLAGGQATCATSSLTAGTHTITAQYSGNVNFAASSGVLPGGQVVNPKADLSVSKVDTPDPVVVGNNLTYTITVTNHGPSTASNVVMTDTLPSGPSFVSATPTQGTCSGTAPVICNLGSMVSGANVTVTIVVQPPLNTPHNTVLSNTATVSNTPEADLNGANNSDTEQTTVVSQPDLTITKTHAGDFFQGQVGASYTIHVSNIEVGPTNGLVTVTDVVPAGLTPTGPVGVVNGWNCAINGQTLTCTRSDLLAGGLSYPDIVLTVNVAALAPASVTNTATVSGGNEVITSNNTATDPTTITCVPNNALNNTGPLMISRFRENGPAGPQDEFVEIHNPSTSPHTVASGNCGGGGYGVYASMGNGTPSNDANLVCSIPNGTVIPAGGYYLCTGATYSLGNLGMNGGPGGATSAGDATLIADIPNDAGLALMNVTHAISLSLTDFNGGVPDAGFIVYDRVGFAPYGPGAPAPTYPSLAGNFCDGRACLQPVGDASTGGVCANPSGLFPVIAAPPACYGQAGQYLLMRRQIAFDPTLGTVYQDNNHGATDFIFVSPNPGTNMGQSITGIAGVTALLGAAAPHNTNAPADAPPNGPVMQLPRTPFDVGPQLGPRNAERIFSPDPTVADLANNPMGTFSLRYKYTNNSGVPLSGLRFGVDNLATLCGAQTATPAVGTGEAQNLTLSTLDCGAGSGPGSFTAILKVLNSSTEVLVDSTGTAQVVHGTVMEDLSVGGAPGSGPLSPLGGGLDSSLVVNPSGPGVSVGDGVTGGTGNFGTTMGTSGPTQELRIRIKFGVVRSGRFILLLSPMAKPSP